MSQKPQPVRRWFDRIADARSLLDTVGLLKTGAATVFATLIFVWSHARHYWGPWAFVASLATFAIALELCVRLPEVLRRTVKVKLIPASGPAAIQLLNVRNCGKEQTFRAECTLLERRNDPNALHRSTFRLEWDGSNKRALKLRRGGSANLVVAIAGETRERDQGGPSRFEWLEICGLSGDNQREAKESSMWQRGAHQFPEYDVEIRIIGNTGQKSYAQRFTVKPGRTSAIQMVEL